MLRRAARATGYALLAVLLTAVMLVLHVGTAPGRAAARDITNAILGSLWQGRIHVGRVETIELTGEVVASEVDLIDPQGRRIVEGARVVGAPVPWLWRGLRRVPGAPMPSVSLHARVLRLVPGRDGVAPSIADAFMPRVMGPPTPPGPPGAPFLFPRLAVRVDRVESELAGVRATAGDARARGGVVTDPPSVHARLERARVDSQYTPPGLDARGAFDWDSRFTARAPGAPVEDLGRMRAAADLAGQGGVSCHFEMLREAGAMQLSLTDCTAPRDVIDAAVRAPVGLDVSIARLDARLPAGGETWTFEGRGTANATPFELRATAGGEHATADLTVRGLDLSRVRQGLPPSAVDGTVHVERHGEQLAVDTTGLRASVQGVPIPGVRARARLRGTRLTLEEAHSPQVNLTARGEVDLAAPMDTAVLDAELRATDLANVPVVGDQARGSVDATVHATAREGTLTAQFDARARGVRAGPVRVRAARAVGEFALARDGTPRVDARVEADGLVAAGQGPLTVRARVAGDPRRELNGTLFADGTAALGGAPARTGAGAGATQPAQRTRINGPFRARITDAAVTVHVPRAAITLRGAAGHVEGEVTIPRAPGGRLAARARVETDAGGSADVRVRGNDVAGQFDAFPLEWVGRAAGVPAGALTGTVQGNLDLLTNRAGRTRGEIRWTGARLPGVGEFDLAVRADHAGELSEFDATATLRAPPARAGAPPPRPPVVHALVHVRPPRDLGDVDGWLRGVHDGTIDATDLHGGLLAPALPRGTQLDGAGAARIALSRANRDGPLDTVIGFDLRDVQLSADAAQFVPEGLRAVVRRAVGVPPLTERLRIRGAVCTRVARADLRDAPVALDASVGREINEPRAELPAACNEEASRVGERLVRAAGNVGGAWFAGLSGAASELGAALAAHRRVEPAVLSQATRARLRDAPVTLRVQVGPIRSDRWPMSPELSAIARNRRLPLPLEVRRTLQLFARPPLPGRAEATVTATGSLFSPVVDVEGQLRTREIEALVARDEIEARVTAHLAAATPGESVLGALRLSADGSATLLAHLTSSGEPTPSGGAFVDLAVREDLGQLLDPAVGLRGATIERLQLGTSQLQLGRLQWARAHSIEGLLSLTVRETGDPTTPIAANATISGLRSRTQQALTASFNAYARNVEGEWEIQACTNVHATAAAPGICDPDETIESAPRGGLRAGLTLPLRGDLLRFDPVLTGVRVALAADHFRLDPVAPFIEVQPIIRVGGEVTAVLAWTARAPRALNGNLHIADGTLEIERVGSPAREVAVDITAEGRHAQISRLAFRLGTGTVRATGAIDGLTGPNEIAEARLNITTDRLPAMQEGNNFGFVTANIEGRARFFTDRLQVWANVLNGTVRVPESPSRELQDLAPNRAVVVLGETRISTAAPSGVYPIDIEFRTRDPIRVQRQDMFLGVRASGNIHYDVAGLAISGSTAQALRQSWFEIFGKRFYFDRLNLVFDGRTEFDPILDVSARYDSPSAGRINVTVTGRQSAPEIRFSSEQFPGASQSEVLAMLVLGRRESRGAAEQNNISQQAQDAAISLLSGLLFGITSDAIRSQVDMLPQLIIQPGANPQQGRYGAGITQLNGRLYIEGTYGAASSYNGSLNSVAGQDPSRAQEVRVLGEFSITEHVSVSGQYGSSQNRFGADVFWSP